MSIHIFCIISLILSLIFLYIYVIKENFDTQQNVSTIPNTTVPQLSIGVQLRNEIGRVLEISSSRINNLIYEGNINVNTLSVDFNILDNNLNTNINNEITKSEAENKAINLFKKDKFFVRINNKSIILRIIPTLPNTSIIDKTKFFNNKGLKEISKYSINKDISVPNDESLTKFYTIGFDTNYKLVPKI